MGASAQRQEADMAQIDLTKSAAWAALKAHQKTLAKTRIGDLFTQDASRFADFSLRLEEFALDYSKNLVTRDSMRLLRDLAKAAEVETWRDRMFAGERINTTEDRAVFHIALRHQAQTPMLIDGKDVMPAVREVLGRMRDFVAKVRDGQWR